MEWFKNMSYIMPFTKIHMQDLPEVGGKNASLGEMITQLSTLGIQVPPGFAATAKAYRDFLSENHLNKKIILLLEKLDVNNSAQLKNVSDEIQKAILSSPFSEDFIHDVKTAFAALSLSANQTVAVRSSATTEDLETASFAGQQETYLNVSGIDNILIAIKNVYASLFSERAI